MCTCFEEVDATGLIGVPQVRGELPLFDQVRGDFRELDPDENTGRIKNLWIYALADAVERWREGKREAYTWLFGPDFHAPGSLSWVCSVLSINRDQLRTRLLSGRLNLNFRGVSVSRLCRED